MVCQPLISVGSWSQHPALTGPEGAQDVYLLKELGEFKKRLIWLLCHVCGRREVDTSKDKHSVWGTVKRHILSIYRHGVNTVQGNTLSRHKPRDIALGRHQQNYLWWGPSHKGWGPGNPGNHPVGGPLILVMFMQLLVSFTAHQW